MQEELVSFVHNFWIPEGVVVAIKMDFVLGAFVDVILNRQHSVCSYSEGVAPVVVV